MTGGTDAGGAKAGIDGVGVGAGAGASARI